MILVRLAPLSAATVVLVCISLDGSTGTSADRCTIVSMPWIRDPAATYVVGEAELRGEISPLGQRSDSTVRGAATADSTLIVYGQVLTVLRFAGADSDLLSATFRAAGSREIILVPQELMADCRRGAWRGWPFLPARHRVFLSGVLAPRPAWLHGRPTFYGLSLEELYDPQTFWTTRDSTPAAPRLSADEYFRYYTFWPTDSLWQADSAQALQKIDSWVQRHRTVAARDPIRHYLHTMHQWLGLEP